MEDAGLEAERIRLPPRHGNHQCLTDFLALQNYEKQISIIYKLPSFWHIAMAAYLSLFSDAMTQDQTLSCLQREDTGCSRSGGSI